MILSDREIAMEIDTGKLIFEPTIVREGPHRQIRTSAVDLRLGHRFRKLKKAAQVAGLEERRIIDPTRIEDFGEIMEAISELEIKEADPYQLEPDPSILVIAETLEFVALPTYLAARVEGRSSLARLGVAVHNTAPTIHAGFRGRIALELSNNGPLTIALRPGRLSICQLILERLAAPPDEPGGGRFREQIHV